MFDLQTLPAPGLEALGDRVELRELPYGQLNRLMNAAPDASSATEAVLAASLYVDGAPIGPEELQELPGRFTGAIKRALAAVLRLHGLIGEEAANEPERGEARAPGEA